MKAQLIILNNANFHTGVHRLITATSFSRKYQVSSLVEVELTLKKYKWARLSTRNIG